MIPPQDLVTFLKESDYFLITTHISPDGDGLGSSNALSMLLQASGKKTTLLIKDSLPIQYFFLPGISNFLSLKDYIDSGHKSENLVLLDCNDITRAGIDDIIKLVTFNKTVVIDHHEISKSFGDIQWIAPNAPATGMMIYYLIKHMGVKLSLEMAINLYTAIAFDTGNFRYENTTPEVFRAAADLTEAGAKPHSIYSSIFEKWTFNRFNLLLTAMKSLELEDGFAMAAITKEMFAQTSSSEDDTESFVSFPRILDNLKVSAIIIEIDNNYYRVSLRAKGGIDVSMIAQEFGGGGHKNAAGFRIRTDLDTLKTKLKDKIKGSLKI